MAEVGSAFVSILPSARGFGSKLNSEIGGDLDGAGKSAGSRFGNAMKVGALAAIGGAALAGKFLKDAVGDASDLAEAQSKVGVVFGKSADQIIRASQSSATAMGLTKSAYLGATGSLGNLLVSLDIAPKKAAGLSQQMVKLAGDLASFNNVSPDEALAALQSGLTGETEPLKKFGVNMNDATLKAQALKMGLISSTKEALDPQTKALAAQKLIMEQTKTAQGDFARTSGGLANQQRILSAEFGNLKATIGAALLPVVTKFVTFLSSTALPAISGLGPVISRIGAFFAPVIAQIKGFFGGGGAGGSALASFGATIQSTVLPALQQFGAFFTSSILPVVMRFIDAVRANFLPVLQTMAATFTGTVLPAITALAAYLAAKLFPVFQQVAAIITGQVVPIVASFASFLYGSLYPAIIGIYVAVASKLKPVFDQLVATFTSAVLPAIQKLLAKFREWQPTIQQVIVVLVKIIGKVLEFAAAILGKVLPPAIKFAGFLLGKLVPAVAGVIGIVVKVIAKIIEFGSAVVDRVQDVAQFVKGLKDKFGDALDYVQGIPGKIKNALTGIGTTLLTAGIDLIRGLIEGIKRMAGQALDAAKSVVKGAVDGVKSFLGIHSPSTVFAEIGENSMLGYKKGVDDNADKVRDAVVAAMKKSLDAMTEHRDKIRSVVDQIKSDMSSLAGSVSSAFTGNLFEATTGADFVSNLTVVKGSLKKLSAAFKKLVKWGLPAKFLSQLFSSGNGALILDLASGSKSTAFDAFQMFGQVQNLAGSLGGAVARNQYGDELRKQTHRLDQINKDIRRIGDDVARALNKTAAHAQRSAT